MLNSYKRVDLTKDISQKKGYSSLYSKKIIEDLILVFLEEVKNSTLYIKNLGTFKRKFKRERVGRNPKTKKLYSIKSRQSVIFTASKNLINKLNRGR